MLEVEQQPVDRAGLGEAFLGQADGGDPGGRGAVDLVAGQLERLTGHPQRPRLAGPGPADDDGHAIPALGEVAEHRRLVLPDGGMAVQDLADDLGTDHRAALTGPLGGAVHELAFEVQQLRGGEPVDPEPAVMGDPDGPLGQELVGDLLGLGERLLGARGDRQPLGERVHHLGAGERARLLGQPARAGQLAERRVQLRPGGRPAALITADLGELPLTHPLLSQLPCPPLVDAPLGLAVVLRLACGDRSGAGRLDAAQALLGQPVIDLF
jgi:hypothetical protein